VSYGNVRVNVSKTDSVTVTNTGTSELNISFVIPVPNDNQFVISPTNATIAPSGTKRFLAIFTPTSNGTKSINVIFLHNGASSPDTISLSGTGVFPSFSISSASINFGSIRTGTSKTDSVTVSNSGTDTLNISSVESGNSAFVVTPITAKIAPSGNKKFYITYTSATGSQSTTVLFNHDGANSPGTVSVSGTGIEPQFSLNASLVDFGDVLVNDSKLDSVVVTNSGSASLVISSVSSADSSFTITPTSETISPNATRKFYITFHPTTSGTRSNTIVFTNDATGTSNLSVQGRGVVLGIQFSRTSFSYGNVRINNSKVDSVTVTNTGTTNLNISNVVTTNARYTVSPSSVTLTPSSSQKFTITFNPTGVGTQSGYVVFTHSASVTPESLSTLGVGVEPVFSITPTSLNFGSVVRGLSKNDTVTVTNTGTGTLTISSVGSSDGDFSVTSVTPVSATLATGASQKFAVRFTPSSSGVKNANITFTHDATGSPHNVTATGTGVTPIFSASTPSISFGGIPVGENKTDSMVVTNTGTSTLSITSVASGNGPIFGIVPISAVIAPSASKNFTLRLPLKQVEQFLQKYIFHTML